MPLIIPNDLQNGEAHDAAPVQENFDAIEQYVNTDVIDRSGSIAMTGQLSLVGDPVSASHAVRKQYVDDRLQGPVPYTPALTASTTNPNLGSTGIAQGQWWKFASNLVLVEFNFEFGGTGITQGSGTYRISIPFPAAKFSTSQISPMKGLVTIRDAAPTAMAKGFLSHVVTHGNQYLCLKQYHTAGFSADAWTTHANVGLTFAAGDEITGFLIFTTA